MKEGAKNSFAEDAVDLLFRFLDQNDGRLSKRARESEFSPLEEDEVERIETTYAETFGDS